MKTLTRSTLLATTLAALALATAPAQAGPTATYSLDTFNVSGFAGPFGSVVVTWVDSQHANFDFMALNGFLLVDGSIADANIAGTWSLGAITSTSLSGFAIPTFSNGGSKTVDGWGKFNQTIDTDTGAFGSAVNTLSFSITATGTTTWTDAASVTTANNFSNVVAAHVAGCKTAAGVQTACDSSFISPTDGRTVTTGFVTSTSSASTHSSVTVPEPNSSALAMLALGLLGAGFWTRRKS